MKNFFRLPAASIVLTVLLSACGLFGEETDAERIARLNAERIDWLENVSFHASYTFTRAGVSTEEEARTKEFAPEDAAVGGFIYKSEDKCRLHIFYRAGMYEAAEENGSGRTVEMIANSDYIVTYTPGQGGRRLPSGSLNRVSDKALTGLTLSLRAIDAPPTLFIPPIDGLPYGTLADPGYESVKTEDGRVRLTFTGTNANGKTKYVKEIVLRDGPPLLAVEESIVRTYKTEDEKLISVSAIRGYDWKDCAGFSIPARVRSYTGVYNPLVRDIDRWVVSEWKSSGIQKLDSLRENFILKLDPDVKLDGLNLSPDQDSIDIDKIKGFNLDSEEEQSDRVHASGGVEAETSAFESAQHTILAVLVTVLFVWGGALFFRKRRHGDQPDGEEGAGR